MNGKLKTKPIQNKDEIVDYMVKRHGPIFLDCLKNETLNKDYSKHPTQVLMKHSIHQSLIDDINTYNRANSKNFGYSCSSLFALKQVVNAKKEL